MQLTIESYRSVIEAGGNGEQSDIDFSLDFGHPKVNNNNAAELKQVT